MKYKKWLTEGANWLVIIFAASFYVIMGLMTFEGGGMIIRDFSTFDWLDWSLWAAITFTPAILSVVISVAADKEGIRQGEVEIITVIKDYDSLLENDEQLKPRSKAQYLAAGAIKKGSIKFVATLVISVVTGQLFLSMNLEAILKVFINLAIWAALAASSFGKSFTFATTELKEWYIIETKRLRDLRDVKAQVRKKEIESAQLVIKKEAEAIDKKKDETIEKLKDEIKSLKLIADKYDRQFPNPDPKGVEGDVSPKVSKL